MNNITSKIIIISVRLLNRFMNHQKLKRKVFCIGLHKTGTTSLYNLARMYGYKATHSTDWHFNPDKIEKFEFFCDGGSHFDNLGEFDFEHLFYQYPDALFILQTRDTRKWVISKLKHIGWNEKTVIAPDDSSKIENNEWTYKSLLTIEKFLEHKNNYEKKVIDFFEKKAPARFLVLDITDKKIQLQEMARLVHFLGVRSISKVSLPHKNIGKSVEGLPERVSVFIDDAIAARKTGNTGKHG